MAAGTPLSLSHAAGQCRCVCGCSLCTPAQGTRRRLGTTLPVLALVPTAGGHLVFLGLAPQFEIGTAITLWTASNLALVVLSLLDIFQLLWSGEHTLALPMVGIRCSSDICLGYFGTVPRHKLFLCCLSQKCHLSNSYQRHAGQSWLCSSLNTTSPKISSLRDDAYV